MGLRRCVGWRWLHSLPYSLGAPSSGVVYVHWNPVRAGYVKVPADYRLSSAKMWEDGLWSEDSGLDYGSLEGWYEGKCSLRTEPAKGRDSGVERPEASKVADAKGLLDALKKIVKKPPMTQMLLTWTIGLEMQRGMS